MASARNLDARWLARARVARPNLVLAAARGRSRVDASG